MGIRSVAGIVACKSFLHGRFVINKHIVHCFESPSPERFETVSRQISHPFRKDERLTLRPEYAPTVEIDHQRLTEEKEVQDNAKDAFSESSGTESEQGENEDEAIPMETLVAL